MHPGTKTVTGAFFAIGGCLNAVSWYAPRRKPAGVCIRRLIHFSHCAVNWMAMPQTHFREHQKNGSAYFSSRA
jgi:hypothetical protein